MRTFQLLPAEGSPAEANADWHSTEPWVRFGMRIVIYLCGGLLLAAMLFSVSGAVVATGAVSVEGEYKAIQHLEGGIISKILVRNGDTVSEGQVLVKMDDTTQRANLTAAASKVAELSIQEARLLAERARKETFDPPAALNLAEYDGASILEAQRALFESRRTAYLGQKKVLTEKLAQADGEIAGAASQLAARQKERELNERELATVRPLFEKGYVNQQRIGPLERESARIGGDIGNLKSEINKQKATRTEYQQRLAQVDKEYSQQAAEELQKVQMLLAEQVEAKKALTDKLTRTDVKAPLAGVVHALSVHTEGGVVQPGATLLQIVPKGGELIIEAKIPPASINSVREGQTASVRFTSFDSHTTPRLEGTVRSVSAAEIVDAQGHIYFVVQVEVPPAELSRLEADQKLVPGMPAEVYLETRARSILSYFLKPLGDMMARAFRER